MAQAGIRALDGAYYPSVELGAEGSTTSLGQGPQFRRRFLGSVFTIWSAVSVILPLAWMGPATLRGKMVVTHTYTYTPSKVPQSPATSTKALRLSSRKGSHQEDVLSFWRAPED
eukprot:8528871-Pyramimonas_sp.AAC.1